MKKIIVYIVVLVSVIGYTACYSNDVSNKAVHKEADSSYTQWYSKKKNEMLLLACVVCRANELKILDVDTTTGFYAVSIEFGSFCCGKYDSVVDAYVNHHTEVNFYSPRSVQSIRSFLDSYFIVSDLIFGPVDSDDKEDEALQLEQKIDQVSQLKKIYRSYVSEGRKLSSLSSTEGSTMLIHLAYYISKLSTEKRNEVLKSVL